MWNVDMIVDKLIFKDVQLTATNDDQYFVFEDVLYQVMLCFSRDPEINDSLQSSWEHVNNANPMTTSIAAVSATTTNAATTTAGPVTGQSPATTTTTTTTNNTKAKPQQQQQQSPQLNHPPVQPPHYEGPPSGIVPFHGICMFAAPFSYLFDDPIKLYFTLRAFYVRYCHRLTTINTHPQGIVSLCLLYEKLLQTHEPQLWSHFRELQIQP